MGRVFYIFIFLIGFLTLFLVTFPAKTITGYLLSQNKISYSKIEGNIFNLKIYDVEYGNIYIPTLYVENNFIKILIKLNMENFLDIDFVKRKAKLKLTELSLEKYQKKPYVHGAISTSIKFHKSGDFLLFKGNGNALLKRIPISTFNNTEITWKLLPEKDFSKVEANLKGKNITGVFKGKFIFPYRNTDKIRLIGRFSGKVFGRDVIQEININPLRLRGF